MFKFRKKHCEDCGKKIRLFERLELFDKSQCNDCYYEMIQTFRGRIYSGTCGHSGLDTSTRSSNTR